MKLKEMIQRCNEHGLSVTFASNGCMFDVRLINSNGDVIEMSSSSSFKWALRYAAIKAGVIK